MKNILIVGDSFAADWTVKYKDHYLGWPNLLATDFNVTNLAQAGCGEYKIWLQLTSIDIKDYDFIIVSHTSPSRIYVKNHPIHNTDTLHKNSDLIYNDIVNHSKKHKELNVIVKFFEEYFDLDQSEFVHKLIQQQIIDYIKEKTDATIIELSHIKGNIIPNARDTIQAEFLYHEKRAGLINHYTPDDNKKVFNILKSIINEPILRNISAFKFSFRKSAFEGSDDKLILYEYNSRGFRDAEWPKSINELKKCIWCFGDSQTVGVGDAYENTWPKLLEKKINKRCINVSMVDASNDWIFDRVKMIIDVIKPKFIVIQWSFLHRYEENAEQKHFCANEILEDDLRLIDKFEKQYDIIEQLAKKNNVKIIHSSVPNDILNNCLEIIVEDFARDSCHYGVKTANTYTDNVIKKIKEYEQKDF